MDRGVEVTEESMDYLKEMMNIAAGNTATALSQLLQCEVEVKLPDLLILPVQNVSSIFKNPEMPVFCAKTKMVGDVRGTMLFVIPDEQTKNLLKLLSLTLPSEARKRVPIDSTAIGEIANIMAGVFLTAVHDFSRLNIFHTVPVIEIDIIQSLIEESLNSPERKIREVLVIENEFIIKNGNVRTFFFVIPVAEYIKTLFNSVLEARRKLGVT